MYETIIKRICRRQFTFIVDTQYLDMVEQVAAILRYIVEDFNIKGMRVRVPVVCILSWSDREERGAYSQGSNELHLYPATVGLCWWSYAIGVIAHEMMHWYRAQVARENISKSKPYADFTEYYNDFEEVAARKYSESFYSKMRATHPEVIKECDRLESEAFRREFN